MVGASISSINFEIHFYKLVKKYCCLQNLSLSAIYLKNWSEEDQAVREKNGNYL